MCGLLLILQLRRPETPRNLPVPGGIVFATSVVAAAQQPRKGQLVRTDCSVHRPAFHPRCSDSHLLAFFLCSGAGVRQRGDGEERVICLHGHCISTPSDWCKIRIQLKNWSQKVERFLNANVKLERVQPPGSCCKQRCLRGRDGATKEHRRGRRWAEWPSTGCGCRPRFQKPRWQAGHPEEQRPRPQEQSFP